MENQDNQVEKSVTPTHPIPINVAGNTHDKLNVS